MEHNFKILQTSGNADIIGSHCSEVFAFIRVLHNIYVGTLFLFMVFVIAFSPIALTSQLEVNPKASINKMIGTKISHRREEIKVGALFSQPQPPTIKEIAYTIYKDTSYR